MVLKGRAGKGCWYTCFIYVCTGAKQKYYTLNSFFFLLVCFIGFCFCFFVFWGLVRWGLNERVLPTKLLSALPVYMKNHVWELHCVTLNVRVSVCKLVFYLSLFTDFTRGILISCYKKARIIYKKFSTDGTDIYMYMWICNACTGERFFFS